MKKFIVSMLAVAFLFAVGCGEAPKPAPAKDKAATPAKDAPAKDAPAKH